MRNEDIKDSEDIANDDIFYAANKRCEELKDKIPHFEMKHKIELTILLMVVQYPYVRDKA